MLSLWLSVAITLSAPGLAYLITSRPKLHERFDRLISLGLLVLIIVDLIPDAAEHAGWWVLMSLSGGLTLPLLLNLCLGGEKRHLQPLILWLGLSTFLAHAVLDGFALITAQHEHDGHAHEYFALGILLHRLPVALSLWWLLNRHLGARHGLFGLVMLSLATLLGGVGGVEWFEELSPVHFGHFQALMSGLLLHVLFHHSLRPESSAPPLG